MTIHCRLETSFIHPFGTFRQSACLCNICHAIPCQRLCQVGLLLKSVQQSAGRRIVVGSLARRLQLALDLLRQDLAQLNAPLVERVDVPDRALGERDMLVVRDQRTQRGRRHLLRQDRGRGAVAEEGLVRHQPVRRALGLDLFRGLANHQSLRLRQEVGCQHALVLATLDRVVRLGRHEEVRGDELGALVQQLEEAVLRVGGRLAEQDRARGVLDVVARAGDGLAVAFHGELLQVGREAVQVLVKGSDEVRLGAEEVAVPHTQQAAEHGDVLLQRGLAEVLIHGIGTGQELVEVVETNVESNGEANGTPDRVAAADPRFEAKHVLLVDAELGDLGLVGREGHKVLSNVSLVLGGLEEPRLRTVGVGSGLSRGEGLGSNQEEGSLGVGVFEGLGDVSAINVGHIVELEVGVSVGFQGLGDHDRATLNVSFHIDRDMGNTYRSEPPMPMLTMVLIFLPV